MNATEFKQKFLPLSSTLYRTAFLLMGNEEDAKDVVQDTFLKLWNMRDSITRLNNPQAYCITITKNLCIDRMRAASLKIVDKPPEELPLAGDDSASLRLEHNETAQMLNRCLARLPSQQQQVIRLRDLSGCSMEDIEKSTGLTAVNVRVLLSRARKTLRTQLQNVISS